LASMECG